uniref:Uncharacterized protein n=1 Tax=Branchiostoma floridae TaxID=7739 RepID=C3YLV3_BRAFL|eukprot:XP_002602535.1 hypothetical protein BRAFLDRAFT_127157 [Branchiostoma floridae]
MQRGNSNLDTAHYGGTRAEWVMRKIGDLDNKARSLRCLHCRAQATWICLDPVCVYYNSDRVVSLCDDCDKRFHPASSLIMNSHRRMGVALYISMLMLHRYHRVVGAIAETIERSPKFAPGSNEGAPKQLPGAAVPALRSRSPPVRSPPRETTESSPSGSASPDSTETGRKRKQEVDDTSEPNTKATRTDDDRPDQLSISEVRPIHESYGRILARLRSDRSLSVSEACMHEPFGKLTVRNYAAIAELKIVDAKLYTSVLDSYMRRGDGSGTLSGFERECRQVLSGCVRQVAAMRTRRELLPSSDIPN